MDSGEWDVDQSTLGNEVTEDGSVFYRVASDATGSVTTSENFMYDGFKVFDGCERVNQSEY